MELWAISFVGGLFGAVLMDIAEARMARYGISSGVNAAYIGRWIIGVLRGVFLHHDIASSSSVRHEARTGMLFHFIIGGGVVALGYPAFLYITGINNTHSHLLYATLFGLVTSALPWLVLMPSFGWGWFGNNAPPHAKPLLAPILSHIPYGLGIGITLSIYHAMPV